MFSARKLLMRMISRNEIEYMVKDFTKFYVEDPISLDKTFEDYGIKPIDRVGIIAAIQYKTNTYLERNSALGVKTFNDLIDLIVLEQEKKQNDPSSKSKSKSN